MEWTGKLVDEGILRGLPFMRNHLLQVAHADSAIEIAKLQT
jgi:hypothetical protein